MKKIYNVFHLAISIIGIVVAIILIEKGICSHIFIEIFYEDGFGDIEKIISFDTNKNQSKHTIIFKNKNEFIKHIQDWSVNFYKTKSVFQISNFTSDFLGEIIYVEKLIIMRTDENNYICGVLIKKDEKISGNLKYFNNINRCIKENDVFISKLF